METTATTTTPAATATSAPSAQPTTAKAAPDAGKAPESAPSVEDFFSDEEIAKLSAKKLKLKVDGKESVATMEQLIRDRQKYEAANKRFQEAKDLYAKGEMSQKQLKDFVSYMKNNTADAMKHLGIDPRQFAESLLMEAIQYEQMSPEQRELIETKKKLTTYESEAKTRQEQEKRTEFQKQVAVERERYDREFAKALQAADIEQDPYAVARLAQYMQAALKSGRKDASPMDFVENLKSDFHKQSLGFLKRLSAEKLLETIPAEIIDKIRKADMARVKTMPTAQVQQPQQRRPQQNTERPSEVLDSEAFRRRMLERIK
jgi:hypothetical protein